MGKYFNMIKVLALITLLSGLALGGLQQLTHEKAENNILKFKKIPAVANIYEAVEGKKLGDKERETVENNLLAEKLLVELEGEEEPTLLFVIKKDGKPFAVTLENFGAGFGGDLGVMAGFNLETGDLVGIGITTLSETPGLGTRVTEESFTMQFRGMGPDKVLKVKKDGGDIDAVTGATISSQAVAEAISAAKEFYEKHKEQIAREIGK